MTQTLTKQSGIGAAGEKASAFAHALGARYHAYMQHLDAETYQDPTTHQSRTYQDGDLTGPYYPKSGYHGPQSVSPWQTLTGAGTVVYVNGMNNNLAAHVEAAQATADKEKHPVVGVFNATGITKATKLASTVLGKTWGGRLGTGLGLAADVAQCLSDDEGDFLNNPAITTLVEVLKRGSNRNIVAHSQGTLIVTAALRRLKDKDGKKRRDFSGYNIKFFGSPASTRIVGPNYVDDTSNNDDAVASFAMDGLSLVRNTRRLPKLLLAQVGIHASAFGDNEISRYNNRILTPDRGKFIGPHNYENYENASPTFDELSSGGMHLPSHTPKMEKTTWPATIRALTGYNAWGPAAARRVTSTSRAVLSGALMGRKWIGSRTHALKNRVVAGANAAFDWSRNEFHAAGRGLGQETQDAGQWMLRNREWIGDTLHEASTIFGVLAAGLGVTALVVPPMAPFLVPAALTFGAAAAAARAWHSTSLAVGTIDGSVSPETALNEAKWAAVDTALSVATVGVSNARFIAKATTVPGMKAVAPILNNPAKTAVTLNHILQQTNKLFGLKLGLILRNPKLASRLGWVSKALATAKFVKKLVELGTSRLLGIAHGIAGGAKSAWNLAKSTGMGLLHWGERRAHQAGEFFHNLKEKYYPSPKHDGDFTGPFFPRGRSPWAGPPPPQSYLRSLVGTGKATLFVNGVNTTYEDHLKTAQRIADDTGSAVVGVFNASGVPSSPKGATPSKVGTALGLLRDAGQTLSDKLFDRVNRNPAVKAVADLIVQYGNVDKGMGGLRIEAHSQGSVIVSEALRQARDRGADIGSKERGKQVHVNTWGNASWTFPLGPEYHHRVHASDVIATGLGSSSRFANFVQTNPLAHWIAERFLGPMANAPADTRVLPHAGTGMEPHFVNQALPAGASGPKPHDYLDDRAKFEKLEQRRQPFSFRTNEQATTRALLPNVTPRNRELVRHGVVAAGRLALPGAASLLGGPLLGAALAEGAAMAAPPLARRVSAFGGQTVAPAYGRLDAGVRALPSLPFLPPNTVWGGADTLLRSAGSRVTGFADWLGGGKGQHTSGPALQRSGHGDHPEVNPAALRSDLRKQSSGFLPDGNLRARLGGHLGFDPGGARLHTGPAAAAASRRLNAEAFTIGNDVFFGEGRFDPHTPKGLGLIAHELTHVGQQTGTTGSKARFFSEAGGDQMEREAQHTAEHVLANAGSRSGLFVEDYVREYEGEGGLTQADQQRLDRISVMALTEAQRMLTSQGVRGSVNADALDVQVEIDLGEMTDSEAARAWAEAITASLPVGGSDNLHRETAAVQRYQIEGPWNKNDPVHETITQETLKKAGLLGAEGSFHDKNAWEYIRGVFWNDDPQGQLFDSNKKRTDDYSSGIEWLSLFKKSEKAAVKGKEFGPDAPLLSRSHFGDMQFIHGMASKDGEAPDVTRGHVMLWAEFAYKVATGEIGENTEMGSTPVPGFPALFPKLAKSTVRQFFGIDAVGETKKRAAGSLLHLIQDSFASGHTEREQKDGHKGKIVSFHSYIHQDEDKHGHDDGFHGGKTVAEKLKNVPGALDAVDKGAAVLSLVMQGKPWAEAQTYLANEVFPLADKTTVAGPGAQYAKPSPTPSVTTPPKLSRHALPGTSIDTGAQESAARSMQHSVSVAALTGASSGDLMAMAFGSPMQSWQPLSIQRQAGSDNRPWYQRAKDDVVNAGKSVAHGAADAAKWVGGTLEGGYNNQATTSQIMTDMGISLIPVVGDMTAARDVSADAYHITVKGEYDKWPRWLSLTMNLIGLVPEAGAVVKDVGRLALRQGGKAAAHVVDQMMHLAGRFLPHLGEDASHLSRYIDAHWGQIVSFAREAWAGILDKASTTASHLPGFLGAAKQAAISRLEIIRKMSSGMLTKAFAEIKNFIGKILRKDGEKVVEEEAAKGEEAVARKAALKEPTTEVHPEPPKEPKDKPRDRKGPISERARALGTDPKRGYVPHEGEVGARIEKKYGGFRRDPSGDAEWISESGQFKGKSFDLLGLPEGKAAFHGDEMEKFLPAVDTHFRKSIDYVVLDLQHMRPAQKATVLEYINKKWASDLHRLIKLE